MSKVVCKTLANPVNNFDIIRLFAATQVALSHTVSHLNIKMPPMFYLVDIFPGVPIFFFISGYLIYQSFSNLQINKIKIFFANRILRLYPALFFCFILTFLSLYFCGYLSNQSILPKELISWAFTQLTFFQFYNPDFLRSFGVGAINGSLWTIAVELQFYILTPPLFLLYKNYKKASIALGVILILANLGNTFLNDKNTIMTKLIGVSFAPWFYMFMVGAYISTNKKLQVKILSLNPFIYLTLYIASYLLALKLNLGTGNGINFISYILLCLLIFKCAYTIPSLSKIVLGGNDISYGIYIFHMPIVNLLLFYKLEGSAISFLTAIVLTFGIAIVSWLCVEKPSLKLKKIALRRYA